MVARDTSDFLFIGTGGIVGTFDPEGECVLFGYGFDVALRSCNGSLFGGKCENCVRRHINEACSALDHFDCGLDSQRARGCCVKVQLIAASRSY